MRVCTGGWIREYMEYTASLEAPDLFHLWTAYSTIASTLGRNVWIDRAAYKLYPNHYILLVAESAECRKSVASRQGYELLLKSGVTRVSPERITNAMLLKSLDIAAKETGRSELVLYSDELSMSLSKEEAHRAVTSTLTRLYSCPDDLVNATKTAGVDHLLLCCVNLFAATTPIDFAVIIPGAATGMGFTPRLHLVYQDHARHRKAEIEMDSKIADKLIYDLREMRMMVGEVRFSKEAWEWWKSWYETSPSRPLVPELDGWYGRKHDHVLKLGMVWMASEGDALVLQPNHLQAAVKSLDQLEEWMPQLYMSVGADSTGRDRDKILGQLERAGGRLTKSQLLHSNWHMGREELDEVLVSLVQAEHIMPDVQGRTTYYVLKKGRSKVQ